MASVLPDSGIQHRKTRSVCPICLSPVDAEWELRDGKIYLRKSCPVHGRFSVPVWKNQIRIDEWLRGLSETAVDPELSCPHGCRDCGSHPQATCCMLLEVTRRCNLSCTFCFAAGEFGEPTLDELKRAVDQIAARCQSPLIQFSGGEPTLREDLPELVSHAASVGIPFTQLNSNGIRLAQDEGYVRRLAEAGLSFVFLQFDGVDDRVYEALRGKPLLEIKRQAIENCGKYGVGVTLVPTVVRGINDAQIGDILDFAAARSPVVRGVHFQPVSFFGRIPHQPKDDDRYTLDELIAAVYCHKSIRAGALKPSRCDHPLCGFHGAFYIWNGEIRELPGEQSPPDCCCGAEVSPVQNREYIARRWSMRPKESCCCCEEPDVNTLDGFLEAAGQRSFTVTAMAFQDAMNLDIKRLLRCSLHVWQDGSAVPFCARYLTPFEASR